MSSIANETIWPKMKNSFPLSMIHFFRAVPVQIYNMYKGVTILQILDSIKFSILS